MSDDPSVRLRPATDGDVALLAELFRASRPELAQLPLPEDQVDAMVALQWRAQRSGHRSSIPDAADWVMEVDGAPVGRVLVDPGPPVTIVDLAVLPPHRGAGVAAAALRVVLADADADRVPVRLRVRWDSPAQRLYARLGFVVADDEGTHLLMVREPGPGPV